MFILKSEHVYTETLTLRLTICSTKELSSLWVAVDRTGTSKTMKVYENPPCTAGTQFLYMRYGNNDVYLSLFFSGQGWVDYDDFSVAIQAGAGEDTIAEDKHAELLARLEVSLQTSAQVNAARDKEIMALTAKQYVE